jgi:hypothetical protein
MKIKSVSTYAIALLLSLNESSQKQKFTVKESNKPERLLVRDAWDPDSLKQSCLWSMPVNDDSSPGLAPDSLCYWYNGQAQAGYKII